ncbi:hypothetical protein F5B22DRAFT_238195 [Xylaria bambusicola]|uniref:uncharacterized protein n=1 Tax=Xylaria bambusicola TaxID=326684 RepID=UPI00200826F6|nr:uncharacterized protein F5B22DRAFT_238195 [Xylaria bambusicola]KAI0514376.1 hypothetical protein F5B22DRAFT_238195 [Xylaria bambusicola]
MANIPSLPSLETQAKVSSDGTLRAPFPFLSPPHIFRIAQIANMTSTSKAAQDFVDHYYETLNKRQSLAPYYASTSTHLTNASVKPDIGINGRVVESVAAYEALLDAQGANVHYTVSSFDAHPVNPNYALGCPENLAVAFEGSEGGGPGRGKVAKSIKDGDRVSFVVQVSGTIQYGKPSDTPVPTSTQVGAVVEAAPAEVAFNESWLLVPHWEALGRNAARGLKKWVVVSQNFRAF